MEIEAKIKVKDVDPESAKTQEKAREDDIKAFMKEIDDECEKIKGSRSTWEDRQARWFKERYGIRSVKKFPFVGASNINMPTIDKHIRQTKPYYLNMFWPNDILAEFSISSFTPMDIYKKLESQVLKDAEMLDCLVKEKIPDVFKKSLRIIDRLLQSGKCLVKVIYNYREETKEYKIIWEDIPLAQREIIVNNPNFFVDGEGERALAELFALELDKRGCRINPQDLDERDQLQKMVEDFKNGKKDVTFKKKIIVNDAPDWILRRASDVLVRGNVQNIQEATLICDELYYTENELRRIAASGKIPKEGVTVIEEVLNAKFGRQGSDTSDPRQINSTYDNAYEKMSGDQVQIDENKGKIHVREVCCYGMPDSSGILQRCILTYFPGYMDRPIKYIKIPDDNRKWQYVSFDLEVLDEGWLSSRGIPAMLDYIATAINIAHNQRRNLITIEEAPMFKYLAGKVNLGNIKFIPGQGIPVTDMAAFEPVMLKTTGGQGLLQEEVMLREYAESYLSSPDFGIARQQDGFREPRKATEILEISSNRDVIIGLDARVFLNSISELLQLTWDKHVQCGNNKQNLVRSGKEVNWNANQYYKYVSVKSRGTYYDTNPVVRLNKANQLMNISMHPKFGDWWKEEPIITYVARALIPENATKYLNTKDEVAQIRQAKGKVQQETLAMAEAAKEKDNEQALKEIEVKGDKEIEKELVKQYVEK